MPRSSAPNDGSRPSRARQRRRGALTARRRAAASRPGAGECAAPTEAPAMTSLYRLDAPASAIAAAFGAEAGGDPWTGEYVAPGRTAPGSGSDGPCGTPRGPAPEVGGVPP